MAPPIIPSMAAAQAQPDVTAVAPPNLGGEAQPQPTYYEQLRAIFNDAVRLAHLKENGKRKYSKREIDGWVRLTASETFQGAHNFRTLDHLANTIQNLDRKGARPITEDDLSTTEKGAFARTVLFGHSVLPFTDEIAGALSFLTPGGQGYRAGRDENRRYLERAREFASGEGRPFVPDVLANPELWGFPAAIAATMGGAAPTSPSLLGGIARAISPARAPGILRSGATGGGFALGYGLAEQPELTPEALREEAVPLAAQTAFGALMAGTPPLLTKRGAAAFRPGAVKMEKALEAAGGEEGIAAAIQRSGTPAPMLAELQSTSFGRLGTELRRSSAEATEVALQRVRAELEAAVQAKQVAGRPWDELMEPIRNERIGQLLSRKPMKRIISRMLNEEALVPGSPITGRVLEDIRQELILVSRGMKRRQPGTAKRLQGWAREIQQIVDASDERMADARRAYGPFAERVARLSDMERRLSTAARSSGIPIERKVTAGSEMMQELGIEPWQRAMSGAREMAGPLYTPGTAAQHVERIRAMQPWYSALSRLTTPAAGMAARPVIDPFFPQEPQEP